MPFVNSLRSKPAQRLIVTVPVELVRRVDALVQSQGGYRADWMREALEERVARLERRQRRRPVSAPPSASRAT